MKNEKGITLVALIITIIVLLILAVVTINAVNEGSLFAHANNAATAYSAAAGDENTMISNYLSELEKHDSTTPSQPGGGDNPQTPPTPASRSDIVGTYYAANGDTDFTIVIGETTLSFVGETVTDSYSNNTITATLECLGATPLVLTYAELPNGTKTLYSTTGLGVPMLFTTNISGLATGTMTGKYSKSSTDYYEFVSATTVHHKEGSVDENKSYTYFSDLGVIHREGDYWFKLEGNTLNELRENGSFTAYTLES